MELERILLSQIREEISLICVIEWQSTGKYSIKWQVFEDKKRLSISGEWKKEEADIKSF